MFAIATRSRDDARVGSAAEIIGIKMFGPLEVRIEGLRLGRRELGGVKPRRLLEVLLLERGRFVSKDRIAELLWGEALPQRVAATVETYVSVLRRRWTRGRGLGGA